MKNGKYQYAVTMDVPLGKRSGLLNFTITENRMNGFVTMFTETLPIAEGRCIGNRISFSGKMKTMLKSFGYIADGHTSRNHIDLLFHTDEGDYKASGKKVFFNTLGETL